MKLNVLSEVIYNFYNSGRPSATAKSFSKADILQYARMGYGNMIRQLAFNAQKTVEWKEEYFYSDLISTKSFKVGETNKVGGRRVDMGQFDLYRLPRNAHMVNVYGSDGTLLTQVNNGEENFYLGSDFEIFPFFVVKGRGIMVYHLPDGDSEVEIEATFDADDVDVSLDICFDIANQILGVVLRIPGFAGKAIDNSFDPPKSNQLKRALNNPQQEQPEI